MTEVSQERIERAARAIYRQNGTEDFDPWDVALARFQKYGGKVLPPNVHSALEAAKAALTADAVSPPAIDSARAEDETSALLIAGWEACRKSVYAVCEDVVQENEKHRDDRENEPRHHFGRGGMSAAKSIARGFNSMEALDDDNLRALIVRTPVAAETDKGWRTIDSAPRDGTRILLAWDDNPALAMHVELGKRKGFAWANTYGHAYSGDPTHWMPLPASPSTDQQGA